MRARKWVWLGMLLTGASCVQILDADNPYRNVSEAPDPVTPCIADANCDDQNPCTIDTCLSEGVCGWSHLEDGPLLAQIAGDCKRAECADGVLVSMIDDADIEDDVESCTTDTCANGFPMHTALEENTSCTIGESVGSCKSGTCIIECNAQNPCEDSNPCTEDLCNASIGSCTFVPLDGTPTPGAAPIAGDCKLSICVAGKDTAIDDDSDIPDDANTCTLDVCTNGVPSNPAQAAGTPCMPGDTNVCDGASACVECTEPSHCVNIVEDECTKRTCVNNKCEPMYMDTSTVAGKLLQKPGDCRIAVCDGFGGTASAIDNTDLPVDGNPCTKDICTNGVPSNPNEPQNLVCGVGLVCNATGKCVGCNTASQCAGTDDFCKTRTCNNNQCGFSFAAAGADLPMGQTAGDCKVLECDGMGNIITSVLQSDVPVDGNACTQDLCSAMGVPSNPPTAVNSPCLVSGNDACDGNGTCKKSLGKACTMGSQCVSTFCVDGYCCNSSCTTTCKSCNVSGSLGTCSNVSKGTDDGVCTGSTVSCNAGECDKANGQACSANSNCLSGFCVDGVCCNASCTSLCKACNLPNSVGTCTNLPLLQTDAPTCSGSLACDGAGACKFKNGSTCPPLSTDCISGFCADGVCCNSACSGVCQACTAAKTGGTTGTCSNILAGTDPDNECTGTINCNSIGICSP